LLSLLKHFSILQSSFCCAYLQNTEADSLHILFLLVQLLLDAAAFLQQLLQTTSVSCRQCLPVLLQAANQNINAFQAYSSRNAAGLAGIARST